MSVILIGILCVVCFVLSVIGNFLVISVIIQYKRLKNATNYILLSLAIADLTVTFCVMLPATIQDILQEWIWNEFFCKFYIALDITCCTASILHLLLVAIDRYIAIFNPLTYQQMIRKWHIFAMVIFVWTLSFSMSFVPIFMGWNEPFESTIKELSNSTSILAPINVTIPSNTTKTCYMEVNMPYAIISSSLSFYIPLIIMTVVYSQIYVIAKRQAKQIAQLDIKSTAYVREDQAEQYLKNVVSKTEDNKNNLINELLSNQSGNNRNFGEGKMTALFKSLKKIDKKATKDKKAIKTLGIIMGIFTFCWLPFFVMYVTVAISEWYPPMVVDRTITWIGYCNSFINPIVYALTNRDFRKAYIATLRSICENTRCIKDSKNKNDWGKRYNDDKEKKKFPYLFSACCPIKNEKVDKKELRKLTDTSIPEQNAVNLMHKSPEKNTENQIKHDADNQIENQISKLITNQNSDSIVYIDELSRQDSNLNIPNVTSFSQIHVEVGNAELRRSDKDKDKRIDKKTARKKSYLDFSDDDSDGKEKQGKTDEEIKRKVSGSDISSRSTRKSIRRVLSQVRKKNVDSFSTSDINGCNSQVQSENKSETPTVGGKYPEDAITVQHFVSPKDNTVDLSQERKRLEQQQSPYNNLNINNSDSEDSRLGKKAKIKPKKLSRSLKIKLLSKSKEKRPSENMILDYDEWVMNETGTWKDHQTNTINYSNSGNTSKISKSNKAAKDGLFIIRI